MRSVLTARYLLTTAVIKMSMIWRQAEESRLDRQAFQASGNYRVKFYNVNNGGGQR